MAEFKKARIDIETKLRIFFFHFNYRIFLTELMKAFEFEKLSFPFSIVDF